MARPNDPNQRKRDSSSPDNPLKGYRERVNVELDRIRETAKWMAGAIALVASILLAGSDLSGIGNLDTCTPRQLMEGSSGTCARFYVALGSGVTAIIATFAAVLLMMKVFLPRDDTMSDFASLKANHRVVKWFREHPTFVRDETENALVGDDDADGMTTTLEAHPLKWLYEDVGVKRKAVPSTSQEYVDQTTRQDRVLWTARYRMLRYQFIWGVIPWALLLAMVIGLALLTLVWAANPPQPSDPQAVAVLS